MKAEIHISLHKVYIEFIFYLLYIVSRDVKYFLTQYKISYYSMLLKNNESKYSHLFIDPTNLTKFKQHEWELTSNEQFSFILTNLEDIK